ncbi:MAG: hypothetical protein ACR2PK_04870 [Acidimicrobiales bacterium]
MKATHAGVRGVRAPTVGNVDVDSPDSNRAQPLTTVGAPRKTLRLTTISLCVLATLILFGLVAFQAVIVSSQSAIDDLDREIETASRMNQRLRLEVAKLESPERIRMIALSNLGMIEPSVVDYLEPISVEELMPSQVPDE